MNLSSSLARARFSNGAAKVRIIFKLPNLFAKIFHFFVSASVFLRTLGLSSHPFFKGSAKVQLFSVLPNFYESFFHTFSPYNPPSSAKILVLRVIGNLKK